MSIPGRAESAVKGLVLWIGLAAVSAFVALWAIGFFIACLYMAISAGHPAWAAAAITGGVLIFLAVVIIGLGTAFLKRMKRRQPSLMQEIGGAASIAGSFGKIAGMVIRKDPRKSMVLAIIAGAVTEYLTSSARGGDRR